MEAPGDPPGAPTPSRPWTSSGASRTWAAAFAAYLVLALIATWPLALHLDSRVLGHVELESTPRLNAWAMSFVRHQLVRDPLHLFDANAFHPHAGTLALSEHLFVPALLGAPVAWSTGNDVLAYNAVTLLTLALAALGAFALTLELVGSRPAAFVAGLMYAFHTWNLNEVVRLQILSNQWFPFVAWALLRFFRRPAPLRAALVGVFCVLQALSCMYWALYLPLLVAPLLAFLQWRHRLGARALGRLGAALLAAACVTVPFALPYVRAARTYGFERAEPESLALGRYLDVLPGNLLYEEWLGTALRNQNAAHFLGIAALALAVLGAARGRFRDPHGRFKPFLIALGAAAFALSLGPSITAGGRAIGPGPYAWLFEWAPGFRHVRYPERFAVFVSLALAPLAGAGLARLIPHIGGAGALALGAFVYLEHLSLPHVLAPMPAGAAAPAVYGWVAATPEVRAIAEVPSSRHRMERLDALPMWFSTLHWKRTLRGFTGYFPPTYNFSKWRLFHFPDPASVEFLERLGIDTVVVRAEDGILPAWFGLSDRWRIAGPFPGGDAALQLLRAGQQPYPPPPEPPALAEVDRRNWQLTASHPGARLAADGDPSTSWTTGERQGRGDFFRIGFPSAVTLARVSVAVRDPYQFPMRLKLMALADAGWVELLYDREAAYDDLFASLLHRPREAWLHLDVEPRQVSAIRLRITETDPFWMPWTLSEVRVWAAPGSP